MQKSKTTMLNAISALMLTMINGVLGLVVTRLVLSTFGSEFNGLNSVATQLINMMLIVEGGFTIATNVALLKPYVNRDFEEINRIIVATSNIFKKIGLVFFCVGIIVTIFYGFLVKTTLNDTIIFLVLIMTFLPAAINLYYTMKYRILIQAEQKEYIISLITVLTITAGHIINISLIYGNFSAMWGVRLVVMICSLVNSTLIVIYCKKKYKFLDFSAKPNYSSIKGTKDVFIQKITGAIYSTLPIIFISLASAGGTALASVYAVYNSVFLLVKSMLYAITNAPRLGMGQTIVENDDEKTYKIFIQYELVSIIILFLFMISASTLIMPFISIYTKNIYDVNYVDYNIAAFLIAITLLEILHIPSGHIINMSGNFKISKKFQIIACILLIVSIVFGSIMKGIYGILFGVFLTALFLAIIEIYYTHCVYFKKGIMNYWKLLWPNLFIGICLSILELKFTKGINNYIQFLVNGTLLTSINFLLIIITNFIFNRSIINPIILRIISFFGNFPKKIRT
ncbi:MULTISPECIES: hypothetical protein [Paenibacillus]|uniref:Polysaccharide biosynthesis protein C-terminal domain-containing protein n=1 Tax=Paenibacillus odorifer TaxID=189426 RepID=A0ABX3HD36_9BACL|nr:hypothetical protein [Paenibacillus odorifer]OMD46965.1 hypothetical protein BSK51_25825 [Paenibacillus odorifer]